MGSWNTIFDLGSLQYAPWRWGARLIAAADILEAEAAAEVPYRPDQWKKIDYEPTIITTEDGTDYVFDAIIRAEHTNSRRITEHPVQTGANISDHSFRLPARVSLEIGMSDVMSSYNLGQWEGEANPKSVTAFLKMREIQDSGQPVSLFTRLDWYYDMVIESIYAPDDHTTLFGLKATITFRQIITAAIAIKKFSVKANKTDVANLGAKNVAPPTTQETSGLSKIVKP